MKKVDFFLLFYCIILVLTYGQNLVPNSSFENIDSCSLGYSQLDTGAAYFPGVQNWLSPCYTSLAQVYAQCFGDVPISNYGYHTAHTGTAFAVIEIFDDFDNTGGCYYCRNTREYIQVQLNETLKKDTQYCVSFFVQNAYLVNGEISYLCTSSIGAYLSAVRPRNYNLGDVNTLLRGIQPQIENASNNYICDTTQWQSIHGIYIAQGGEQWLTIGNFYNDTQTVFNPSIIYSPTVVDSISYMLIDDVSVTPITFPAATHDTLLCDTTQLSETLTAQPGGNYYQWSNGDSTPTVVIHQPGTYWYLTDFGCGPVIDSIHIRFQPKLSGSLPADTNGCAENLPVYLGIDSGFTHYIWNTGDTSAVIAVTDSGMYSVTATYACGTYTDSMQVAVYPQPALPPVIDTGVCVNTGNFVPVIAGAGIQYYSSLTDSVSSLLPPVISTNTSGSYTFYAARQIHGCISGRSAEQVNILAAPLPDVVNNVTTCQGQPVKIGEVNNRYNFLWSTSDTTNMIVADTPGIYTITEENNCGTVTEYITVQQTNCQACLYIPNAFTPNGDGNNDVFKVYTNCPIGFFHCLVFDRIGEKVFESNNPAEAWDGTYKAAKLNPGVFVYVITYVADNNQAETFKGSVTLIR